MIEASHLYHVQNFPLESVVNFHETFLCFRVAIKVCVLKHVAFVVAHGHEMINGNTICDMQFNGCVVEVIELHLEFPVSCIQLKHILPI